MSRMPDDCMTLQELLTVKRDMEKQLENDCVGCGESIKEVQQDLKEIAYIEGRVQRWLDDGAREDDVFIRWEKPFPVPL